MEYQGVINFDSEVFKWINIWKLVITYKKFRVSIQIFIDYCMNSDLLRLKNSLLALHQSSIMGNLSFTRTTYLRALLQCLLT